MINTNSKILAVVRNIKVKCTFDAPEVLDDVAISRAKKLVSKSSFRKAVDINSAYVFKKSVDARNCDEILLIYSVAFIAVDRIEKNKQFDVVDVADIDSRLVCSRVIDKRPVVAGFGPSGMFCALALAKAGLNPIVVERGSDVDTRAEKVNEYWTAGRLDRETNVQFGEGGAGTFSDGKLLTRINDKLCSYVMHEFVKNGAPKEIMYLAKPHIGTDNLRKVVKNIREEIIRLGGSILFNEKLISIETKKNYEITAVKLESGLKIECDALFLCIGHSARDTVKGLQGCGVVVEPKPFSVGVRIEHLQRDIDAALYGSFAGARSLGAASYTLSHRFGKRAVYSFCMCPGGTVVASASNDGQIVTNGMSNYARDGVNANSAIAVSVDLSDFDGTVDGAIEFQHSIEERAFEVAGGDGTAPIQTLSDFFENKAARMPSKIFPTYTGKTRICRASDVFPEFITAGLKQGISAFDGQIKGFADPEAVLTFPETRTSSPFKMPRRSDYNSLTFVNLYPCGEGAGYAGGITSAAVDGLRAAMKYMNINI